MHADAPLPGLDMAWFDAVSRRTSRRRFSDAPVAASDLEALRRSCQAFRPFESVHTELLEDRAHDVFTGIAGSYGRVDGARWIAAFVGPPTASS